MSPLALLYEKLSNVRHMMHVVNSKAFDDMYKAAKDKTLIDAAIDRVDRTAFDKWVYLHTAIEDLSIRELRVKASNKRIPCYSRMDKATLVKELKDAHAG